MSLNEFFNRKLCELLNLKPEELTPEKLHDIREKLDYRLIYSKEEQRSRKVDEFLKQFSNYQPADYKN